MKKNTFLYIVIAVLVIALAGLGALNVRSLDKLASLQTKVNKLQKSVQEVSDSAAELSSKADQLDALYPDDPTVSSAAAAASSAEVQGPSAQEESTDTSAGLSRYLYRPCVFRFPGGLFAASSFLAGFPSWTFSENCFFSAFL